MKSLCHHCGAELSSSEDERGKLENGTILESHAEQPIWLCRTCYENQHLDPIYCNASGPASPMISPTTSLSSSDRSVSSCSDLSVDVNSHERVNKDEDSAKGVTVDKIDLVHKGTENGLENYTGGNNIDKVIDLEILEPIKGQEARGNDIGDLSKREQNSQPGDDLIDSEIWEPPEADNPEDDIEGSVGFIDDEDEECGDGTKWGKPSSLSSINDEGSRSYKLNEQKQKEMHKVMNGKFKAFVSQVLKGSGVVSLGKDGENWVDIVTSLSWEAASFFKPDAVDGKVMDPNVHVKVKCIAAGSRSESQVVKGLVFKKHAAHKHMPTAYKNPKLMLIRGVLGQSSDSLSSFKAIEQEKGSLMSLIEVIESCHPNVVLVEKSVSRDVQESILAKGMTLVYDMKLHRLERVARCTGSSIFSSDALVCQKLKQCESFRFEKFVEEHAGLGEGGKKPSKTLMFIEGCPTRMGCTILLKGSHSDELKKVKCVVQCAVIMAYHLILETSFLVDQNAMLSSILFAVTSGAQESSIVGTSNPAIYCIEDPATENGPPIVDIPISNGFHKENSPDTMMELEDHSVLSYVPYNPAIFSGLASISNSLKKAIGCTLPVATSSAPYQYLTNYFGLNQSDRHISEGVQNPEILAPSDNGDIEAKHDSEKKKLTDSGNLDTLVSQSEYVKSIDDQFDKKDDISPMLDSQSILVLMSSRNAFKGTICEQSHFSHIMFYKNFDVPLGKFLQDNLLNQRRECTACGELPESHFYYYAHHNKQLTIRVKRLLKVLPGATKGKLWMWSCCSKCKHENETPKSTKRVLISDAACCLSFGKFLELSFSHWSSNNTLSSCGHSLERDFLYFFGFGPLASMFKYSSVTTYFVSLPPRKLEFRHSVRHDRLKQEFENVHAKGVALFSGLVDALKKLKSQFARSALCLGGSSKEFSDIEEMLRQESSRFEARFQKAAVKKENENEIAYKSLYLNQLVWELLLEAFIWEQRLHSLLLPDPCVVNASDAGIAGRDQFKNANDISNHSNSSDDSLHNSVDTALSVAKDIDKSNKSMQSSAGLSNAVTHFTNGSCVAENFNVDDISSASDLHGERSIPIATDVKSDSSDDSDSSRKGSSPSSLVSTLENSKGWFWMPFSEILHIYTKDLQRGIMPKFQPITSSYIQEHMPVARQLITDEGSRLHIPLVTDNAIVRDYDAEQSTIIACALAFLKDISLSPEVLRENSSKEGGHSGLHILTRIPTMISPHWPSTATVDSDSVHSTLTISSEDSRFSSFDGLNLLESLVPPENLSPEVSLGVAKSLGKGKFSVICLYAKLFRDLRSRCCPSEVDYIASLSRCQNWDAKGGKSKSVFAKTLDDRFIIKEIKKTEFESFVKFAPHYFKYMNESFDSGNQTCLAKVVGIYQVIYRQTKGGKEVKHDLMVMENVSFGRNITRQYDLKGALHDRLISSGDGLGSVLLDQNFVNDMNSSPLYVSNRAKRLLARAVWNDTTFLNSINVMDYSLLVGVDAERRELVCGIIDYLRQYTWDKQLETWVKSSLVVPKNVLPTIISPKEYKKRFRKFMATYFLSVPDTWCSQTSSDPCQLCGITSGHSMLRPC